MIEVGICGYGNLGRGVEKAISLALDINLVGIFTRRNPKDVITSSNVGVYHIDELKNFKKKIDVLILCGGSAVDLPVQTPELVKDFNVVDSFDTHANILNHYNNVDANGKKYSKLAIVSVGWDPGLFSLNRLYMEAILPYGCDYTFWGKGVSQGHSDAIRRIAGVKNAKQYTIPKALAVEKVKSGLNPLLSAREKHLRECFVVLDEEADKDYIEKEIKNMPNYFADYETIVNFISQEEFDKNHAGMAHGGFVIRTGETSAGVKHKIEYNLSLDSNPEFTGSVMLAYARACYRLNKEGKTGCITVFDVAPKYISNKPYDELLKRVL